MYSSIYLQAIPNAVDFLWSCDKLYHKQEAGILLYFLGQLVTWQYKTDESESHQEA